MSQLESVWYITQAIPYGTRVSDLAEWCKTRGIPGDATLVIEDLYGELEPAVRFEVEGPVTGARWGGLRPISDRGRKKS